MDAELENIARLSSNIGTKHTCLPHKPPEEVLCSLLPGLLDAPI